MSTWAELAEIGFSSLMLVLKLASARSRGQRKEPEPSWQKEKESKSGEQGGRSDPRGKSER